MSVGQRRGFVRFLYGAPIALVLFLAAMAVTGLPPPAPNLRFLLGCIAGGLTQILATNLLIMAFGYRNFAVGTAYSKTDVVQSAVIALILLHEVLRPLAWAGIALGLCGVMTLSLAGRGMRPRDLLAATVQPAALVRPRRRVSVRVDDGVHQARQSGAERSQPCRARPAGAGGDQHLADADARRLAGLAGAAGIAQGVLHLAQLRPGLARCRRRGRPAGSSPSQ